MNLRLCVGVIVKDEAESLLEWIAFHRVIGFDYFYVADNESSDGSVNLLSALEAAGVLKFFSCITPADGNVQLPAYNKILDSACDNADVLAFIDADEFVIPLNGDKSIRPYVERMFSNKEVGAVGLNWANFGSNDHVFYEDELVIDRFTRRAKKDFQVHQHLKMLVRPKMVSSFVNPHFANLSAGRLVDSAGSPLVNDGKYGPGLSEKVVWDGARINHYATKSLEEFLVKKSRRGSATKTTRIKHKEYFQRHNKNEEECLIAKQFSAAVKQECAALEALMELKQHDGIVQGASASLSWWKKIRLVRSLGVKSARQ